jgi:hypothetical protein
MGVFSRSCLLLYFQFEWHCVYTRACVRACVMLKRFFVHLFRFVANFSAMNDVYHTETVSLLYHIRCGIIIIIITLSVFWQVHNSFRSEFSRDCYLVLTLSSSSIFCFPYRHPVAAYAFFLIISPSKYRIMRYLETGSNLHRPEVFIQGCLLPTSKSVQAVCFITLTCRVDRNVWQKEHALWLVLIRVHLTEI